MNKIVDPKCPGNDPTLRAVPEVYTCPECGSEVEIWSDETKGKCMSCNKVIQKEQALKNN